MLNRPLVVDFTFSVPAPAHHVAIRTAHLPIVFLHIPSIPLACTCVNYLNSFMVMLAEHYDVHFCFIWTALQVHCNCSPFCRHGASTGGCSHRSTFQLYAKVSNHNAPSFRVPFFLMWSLQCGMSSSWQESVWLHIL